MLEDKRILIAIMIAALVCVVIAIKIKIKKAKEKELDRIAKDKLRDQALNKALANHLYKGNKKLTQTENLPYEVDYTQKQSSKGTYEQDKIMLQITICSELSKRKFMVELKEHVTIGKAKDNEIVIKETKALARHCEIFRHHNTIYIKNLSGSKAVLCRKGQKAYVDEQGLKVRTGDKLAIEDTILKIIIIDKIK